MLILSLSHDIKTPLSAIKLYAKALYENLYESEEKKKEIAHLIENNGDKIEDFVVQIVKMTKNDFLHIEVNNTEFYLVDLIEHFRGYYEEKLNLIKVDFKIAPFSNCLLVGDMDRCLETMENIVENAIKYGDGKEISVDFAVEEDMQLIQITNTGCNLPKEEVVHIFESFYRGSNAEKQNGSGLGLYICREIMRKMNGEIFAEVANGNMIVTLVVPR